jgi:hypothetical protein
VVRTHPVSGRKALFVNEGFTTRINELSELESDALLRLLFAHATRPEFSIRWRWQENDVAFWDNRVTQHFAVDDYRPNRRVMHRATILGMRRSAVAFRALRGPAEERTRRGGQRTRCRYCMCRSYWSRMSLMICSLL